MKSSLVRLSLILAVMLTSLIGTTALAQEPQPILGAVNIIQPELFILEPGADEEGVIRSPTVFDPGEQLRTDATGNVLITWFYDGTETAVAPNTTLKLNDFSGDSSGAFVLDLEIVSGYIASGMGDIAAMSEEGAWTIKTPAFTVKPIKGQFEIMVDAEGKSTLVVSDGRVEASSDGNTITVNENQYLVGAPGEAQTLSEDGITVALEGVCTATVGTNMNVRLAPSEDSRKLGSTPADQVLWAMAGTEGNVWLQVYFMTGVTDEEGHNYGWIYGPAATLDEATCAGLLRAPLVAHLYGGPGIDKDEQAQ
ncbi:MAG: hypothetical protein JXJ20_09515 [Anaerolineae bacterium]|nr:hypothetical protein [Anaerolineae bacterium]